MNWIRTSQLAWMDGVTAPTPHTHTHASSTRVNGVGSSASSSTRSRARGCIYIKWATIGNWLSINWHRHAVLRAVQGAGCTLKRHETLISHECGTGWWDGGPQRDQPKGASHGAKPYCDPVHPANGFSSEARGAAWCSAVWGLAQRAMRGIDIVRGK